MKLHQNNAISRVSGFQPRKKIVRSYLACDELSRIEAALMTKIEYTTINKLFLDSIEVSSSIKLAAFQTSGTA